MPAETASSSTKLCSSLPSDDLRAEKSLFELMSPTSFSQEVNGITHQVPRARKSLRPISPPRQVSSTSTPSRDQDQSGQPSSKVVAPSSSFAISDDFRNRIKKQISTSTGLVLLNSSAESVDTGSFAKKRKLSDCVADGDDRRLNIGILNAALRRAAEIKACTCTCECEKQRQNLERQVQEWKTRAEGYIPTIKQLVEKLAKLEKLATDKEASSSAYSSEDKSCQAVFDFTASSTDVIHNHTSRQKISVHGHAKPAQFAEGSNSALTNASVPSNVNGVATAAVRPCVTQRQSTSGFNQETLPPPCRIGKQAPLPNNANPNMQHCSVPPALHGQTRFANPSGATSSNSQPPLVRLPVVASPPPLLARPRAPLPAAVAAAPPAESSTLFNAGRLPAPTAATAHGSEQIIDLTDDEGEHVAQQLQPRRQVHAAATRSPTKRTDNAGPVPLQTQHNGVPSGLHAGLQLFQQQMHRPQTLQPAQLPLHLLGARPQQQLQSVIRQLSSPPGAQIRQPPPSSGGVARGSGPSVVNGQVNMSQSRAQGAVPGEPILTCTREGDGISLSWTMKHDPNAPNVQRYELLTCPVHSNTYPSPPLQFQPPWVSIGFVDALPLPMACTLNNFARGSRYWISIRAHDVFHRAGPLSRPQEFHIEMTDRA